MEARDRHLALLKRTPLGQTFSDPELQQLLDVASISEADTGSLLFVEGSPSDNLWILLQGEAELLKQDPSGQAIVLETIPAGGLVGELGFVLNRPQIASLRATQPAVVLALHRSHFDRLVSHSRLGSKLSLRLTELAHQHLESRLEQVAEFLQDYRQALDTLGKLQAVQPEGDRPPTQVQLHQHLAQQTDRLNQHQQRFQQQFGVLHPQAGKSRRPVRGFRLLGSVVGIGAIGATAYFGGFVNARRGFGSVTSPPDNAPPFVIPDVSDASQCTGDGRYWYGDRCFDLRQAAADSEAPPGACAVPDAPPPDSSQN